MNLDIASYVSSSYMICNIILTFLILSILIDTTKKIVKILASIVSGLIIGFIFYHFKLAELQCLITSFFVSIIAYDWGIKYILNIFNVDTYNNNIGIKI
jgi:hypothetical protein